MPGSIHPAHFSLEYTDEEKRKEYFDRFEKKNSEQKSALPLLFSQI